MLHEGVFRGSYVWGCRVCVIMDWCVGRRVGVCWDA